MQNSFKENEIKNTDIKLSFLKRTGKRNYAIASGAIFAIIVFHFVFQFSFIQSENFRSLQNLTLTGQFNDTRQIAENIVVPEINKAEEEDEKPKVKIKTEYQTKKPDVTKKPEITPPPIQSRRKTAPVRTIIKRKVPQPETRAEQLRRAERILTGA